MLYPTAGSRLFIADAPVEDTGTLPAAGWVEIGSAEAIGMLGVEWDLTTADVANDTQLGGPAVEVARKAVLRRPEMPIILGNEPTDPGQVLLWAAVSSSLSYPFRLVFPGGATTRHWFALVIRIGEVFDTANSVMKLKVDLKPTSPVTRTGG